MVKEYSLFLCTIQIFAGHMLKRYYQKHFTEAGCDEAGRGCFAGPVFAAAVILSKKFFHPLLNDSKQVDPETREELRIFIEAKANCYAVAMVDHEEIDAINILKASFKAMHLALDALSSQPELLLIDGNRFTPYKSVKHECIIQGDGKYASIAAASILAKTYRDAYMVRLHEEFPHYNWKKNKGYGTPEHRTAIGLHGLCRYHRKSFDIIPKILNGESIISDDDTHHYSCVSVSQAPAPILITS